MKQNIIIVFIVFCVANVNIFALNNFIKEQKSHHHKFCSILSHEHSHLHNEIQHSHGHVHKINLVDFHTANTQLLMTYAFKNDKPSILKLWLSKSYPIQLFRPPIS